MRKIVGQSTGATAWSGATCCAIYPSPNPAALPGHFHGHFPVLDPRAHHRSLPLVPARPLPGGPAGDGLLLNFSMMALTGIPLDMTTIMVFHIAIGWAWTAPSTCHPVPAGAGRVPRDPARALATPCRHGQPCSCPVSIIVGMLVSPLRRSGPSCTSDAGVFTCWPPRAARW